MALITGPLGDFIRNNASSISQAGAGLASNGLAGFAYGAAQGMPVDQQRRDAATQLGAETQQKNATKAYLGQKYPDLVPLVDAGQAGVALQEAFKRQQGKDPQYFNVGGNIVGVQDGKANTLYSSPEAQPDPAATTQGRTQLADQQGLKGNDRLSYILTGKLPEETKPPAPPSGYQPSATGNGLEFIPGGPADPSTAGKTTEATRRNQQLATVIVPELTSLLGDGKTPGTFDALASGKDQAANGALGWTGLSNFATSPAYQQAQNSLKTIVASYLYSVSGATANPGEVQNQVDVLTPKPGEDPQTIAAKKARLQQMVQAVVAAASGTPISVDQPDDGGNIDDLVKKYGG